MFLEDCQFKGKWRKYQEDVLNEFEKHMHDDKINIVAAPGSGKTILGLEMISRLHEHVLILTPTITIRQQWIQRFLDMYVPSHLEFKEISEDIYALNHFNVVTYQALHYAFNQKKIQEEKIEDEEEINQSRIKTEVIEYDLIEAMNKQLIHTIVLDEAHHLRAEWWKSLREVLKKLEGVKVISLTATPPYDVDENEWSRYEEVCGPIDAEISVPELVATNDLCPHQDYIMFNMVTRSEEKQINQIKKNIRNFIESLKDNVMFIDMLENNTIYQNWRNYEDEILSHAGYYSSLCIFLNEVGKPVDKELVKLLSDGYKIPKFNQKFAEQLLQNILFEDRDTYKEYEDLIKNLKKQLEVLGCIEKGVVYLENVSAVKKLMATSMAKMESIETIVEEESTNLRNDLSLVILTDYVRSDYLECDMSTINKLGVVPIFRHLLERKICDHMAVLTGKLKIVPKSLVPYINEQLQFMDLEESVIFTDLEIDDTYVQINGNKKIDQAIVKIVTECIELKKINVVIGTVALLGEGWDAPSINSLILASYVGSFMLSNQMRGRAIRQNKEKNKTANIWHLASLARMSDNQLDFSDYDTLKRRFKSFVGIHYEEDVIQDGIERLSYITKEALHKDYQQVNKKTIELSYNREGMAQRWKKILDLFGGNNIQITKKIMTNMKLRTKTFIGQDIKKVLFFNVILSAMIFAFGILRETVYTKMILYFILNGYYLLKVIGHLNPMKMMDDVGKVVLDSMTQTGKLLTNRRVVSNIVEKVDEDDSTYYKTYLQGATVYENNLFITAIKEIYSQVIDTRYLIKVGKGNIFLKDTYFNVPDMFDGTKKEAEVFLKEWNSKLLKGELVFTRNKEGRKILIHSRKHSFDYHESFFERKEVSQWQ